MSTRRILVLALGLLVAPSLACGAEKRATLAFVGDNGGEVAPCG